MTGGSVLVAHEKLCVVALCMWWHWRQCTGAVCGGSEWKLCVVALEAQCAVAQAQRG